MYRKSAIPLERLFSSAGYIVNKTRSLHDVNTVNLLVCEWGNACAIRCF